MEEKHPSILKIIWTDFWSNLSLFLLSMMTIIFIVYLKDNYRFFPYTEYVAPATMGFFIVVIAWRCAFIVGLLENGGQVRGKVISSTNGGERRTIKYIYEVHNQRYLRTIDLYQLKWKKREPLPTTVSVVYDLENPKRSTIKEFFM